MRNQFYKDRFAWDGIISTGWRIVRSGGRVKVAGRYWHAKELESIVGELVYFVVYDYWMEKLIISRGVVGCIKRYCDAR